MCNAYYAMLLNVDTLHNCYETNDVIITSDAGEAGTSGAMLLKTGTSSAGSSGSMSISTGSATSGESGALRVAIGSADTGVGGSFSVQTQLDKSGSTNGNILLTFSAKLSSSPHNLAITLHV